MHPLLLHRIADDRVIERRRSDPPRQLRRQRRSGWGATARLRSGVGGLLIAVGIRVAGTRAVPVGLYRTPT